MLLLLFSFLMSFGAVLDPPATPSPSPAATSKPAEKQFEEPAPDAPPVVTHHSITVGGTVLKYTVTTGLLPSKNRNGETEANMFFVAYTRDDAGLANHRPLTVAFNGGPGSASVWLHLGAIGPRRVKLLPSGLVPPPPYSVVDNEYSWLPWTDVVFVDPVGTGFSRPTKPEFGPKFWGLRGDISSVGDFIRLYITRYQRWSSPLFLAGESYGTTRAAGLSNYLIEHGIALNGIVLISSALNFQTLDFSKSNELPYVLYLPTYTATAWYHKRLAPDLERDLDKTLAEAEHWSETEYASALARGDSLTPDERSRVAEHMARYTGLPKQYLLDADLRLEIFHFCKELLHSEKRSVGRLDSRFTGIEASGISETPDFDPSEAAIRPPFTSAFNDYVRTELGYRTDQEYYVLGGGITSAWDWGTDGEGFPDTTEALRSAFAKNPAMKVFVACGYFDLATPYVAARYALSHTGLDPAVRGNVSMGYYRAGHMVYIESQSIAKLRDDVSRFMGSAIGSPR